MAKIERTYNQEKAKQILKHNVALLDYSLRELPLDAVLPSRTDKGMNYSFTPTLMEIEKTISLPMRMSWRTISWSVLEITSSVLGITSYGFFGIS